MARLKRQLGITWKPFEAAIASSIVNGFWMNLPLHFVHLDISCSSVIFNWKVSITCFFKMSCQSWNVKIFGFQFCTQLCANFRALKEMIYKGSMRCLDLLLSLYKKGISSIKRVCNKNHPISLCSAMFGKYFYHAIAEHKATQNFWSLSSVKISSRWNIYTL